MAMQDEIKIISTEEAIKSLNILEKKLKELDTQFIGIVKTFEKGFKPIKLSDYKNAIKNENDYANSVKENADKYIKAAYEKREKEKQIESKKQADINKAFAQQEEKTKKEIALKDKLLQKEIEVGLKEIESRKKKEQAYTKLLATYKKSNLELKELILTSEKSKNKDVELIQKIKEKTKALDDLNIKLNGVEFATKKYAVGASSLARPVLLYAENLKKATQAEKDAIRTKEQLNAKISKQMTGAMVEYVGAIGKPSESLKRLNDYYRELEKSSAAEAKAVLSNKKLADAYGLLSEQREKAKRALQNSIVETGKSSIATRQLQKDFDALNKKVAEANKAVGRFSDANRNINGLAMSVRNLMSAFGISTGIYLFVDVIKGIYETTKQLQSLDLALKMVSGTEQEFAENKVFLKEVSNKWGVELKGLTEEYTKFYTASKGVLTDEQIKNTFESISKSGALMGLSVDKQKDTFYALEQMMSKGVVTAEELKKQLGNAMPGAIRAAAMAYQDLHPKVKTIQEAERLLLSDMKKGAIDSATYVPLIVKNFEKLYGIEKVNEVNTIRSAQERLMNSWTEWVRGLSSSNATTTKTIELMNFLAENLESVINFIVKGTVMLGVYLGVQKTVNFLTSQAILLSRAYAIAKALVFRNTVAETGAEIANTTSKTANTIATKIETQATIDATKAANAHRLAMIGTPWGAIIALVTTLATAYLLLRDNTDDAKMSLLEYENAKKSAENKAKSDVGQYNKPLDKSQLNISVQENELLKLRKLQKTATGEELADVKSKIEAKKKEIEVLKEKYALEVKMTKIKKEVDIKSTTEEAKDLEASTNSLKLQDLNQKERRKTLLNKQKEYNSLSSLERQKIFNEIIEVNKEILQLDRSIAKNETNFKDRGIRMAYLKERLRQLKPKSTKLPELDNPKDKDKGETGRAKIDKTRKVVDFTNFSEIDLQIAQLNKDKAIINDRMNNESATFKEKLELRSQFSRKNIEILDLEMIKEKKIIEDKAKDDKRRNEQTRTDNLNNKNLSKKELAKVESEFDKNKTEINKRLINDLAKAKVEHSDKIRNVLGEDFKYYKAIQEEKRDLIRSTAKIERDIEKENLSRIINNDIEGTFFSFNARNVAQERYIELLNDEAESKKLIGIAEAKGDPLKKAKVLADYEKDLNDIKNIQTVAEKAKVEIDKLLNSFSSDFIKNSLDTLKMPSLNKFLNFDENGLSEFDKIMDLMNDKTANTTEEMAVSFQMVGDVFQEVMGLMNELSQSRFEAEQARIEEDKIKMEEQYKIASDFTNGNVEAQKRVDEEYERRKKEMAKREKELAKKQFDEKKKTAIMNIAIDTAQAVVSVLAQEKGGATKKIIAAAIISAMGLAQMAIVKNQKMPQYKDGTLNHVGGLALVNDGAGSNYQETIVTPDGSMIRPKDRNVVMDLPKGTQVYNHEQFQRHLNNISQEQVNYTNVNGGVSFAEMDILLGKHIASQTHVSNQFSGGELVEFVNRKGNIVKRTASRGAGIGIRFN